VTDIQPPYQPEWMAESPQSPQWGPAWIPPTLPAGAGGGYGSAGGYGGDDAGGYGPGGPVGPAPAWVPPPPQPQPEPRTPRARNGVALILVAALIAAVIGVVIGRNLGRSNTATVAAASTPATIPSSGSTSPFGGSTFNPFGSSSGTSGGSGSAGGVAPTAPSSGAVSATAAAIAAKVTPGIVDIDTQLSYANEAAAGTGMVLTSTGEILTNNHVINGATSITVTVPSTGRIYTATVVGFDVTQDVAVIQLKNASGLKTIPTGNSDSVNAGDAVVALGNAGGVGGAPSIVTGTVAGLDQTIMASDEGGGNAETLNGMIETNAPIQAGDSGGPLVNSTAQVIGMDTAASSSVQSFGGASSTTSSFAIPINTALSIARQIESGKATSLVHIGLTGFLGVGVSSTATGNGALILSVAPNTPAQTAGLEAGDEITSVNGSAITSGTDLTTALASHHPGDKVTMSWTTGSSATQSATITLAAGPAD